MKSVLRIATLAVATLSFTSCIQNSTVIRVNKDGSGSIFARYFFAPQVSQMLGGLAGAAAGLGGDAGAQAPDVNPQNIFDPDEDTLKKDAASYGEGVTFAKKEKAKNKEGWDGFLVVYDFADINKVKFDPNKPPGPLAELEKMNPDAAAEAKANVGDESTVSFAMADGVLTINTGVSPESMNKIADSGGGGELVGADGTIPPEAAAQMQMAAGMMQGLRMGAFLRINPGIAETNAQHVTGNLITLSDVQMAAMMGDPKFLEFMQKAAALGGQTPDDAAFKDMLESMSNLNGLTMETQQQITVKFE